MLGASPPMIAGTALPRFRSAASTIVIPRIDVELSRVREARAIAKRPANRYPAPAVAPRHGMGHDVLRDRPADARGGVHPVVSPRAPARSPLTPSTPCSESGADVR